MKKLLRATVIVVLLSVCLASAIVQGMRQRQREAVRPTELFEVIWQQVAAFRARDVAAAYRQASLNFQERFNMEAFADLVQSDYPLLRMADRVEFGAVRWEGREALVPAYFFLPDREVIPCLYSLVQEDGVWKIERVIVQKRWRAGQRLGGLRT